MKRYFSHYTILPGVDSLLKEVVVEVDDLNILLQYYTYELELSHTEYRSGLNVFVGTSVNWDLSLIRSLWMDRELSALNDYIRLYMKQNLTSEPLRLFHFY
ncbi:MAG: hypothetical protein QM654_11895 [Dysgonamonadaceae bacterium]